MSGLEAVGITAGIIQIADLGTKLSVKLFTSYRRMKNASQSIQNLSSDVALTCAILRELGENLESDEQSKLCSDEAFRTARHILTQCEEVVRQIQDMIKHADLPKKSRLQQAADSFRNVLLEPDLDPLKQNLERLKSTMLLLLNVIMYAGQVRNHVSIMLHEQRVLIERLLEEKQEEKQKDETPSPRPREIVPTMLADNNIQLSKTSTGSTLNEMPRPQDRKSEELDELGEYNVLIQKMVHEIDSCKSKLETRRHTRIKKGVLGIHDTEVVRFQLAHGNSVLQRFDASLFEEPVSDAPSLLSATNFQKTPTWNQSGGLDFQKIERPTGEVIQKRPPKDYFDDDDDDFMVRAAASRRAREERANEAFRKAVESDAQSAKSRKFGGWFESNRTNTDTVARPIKATLGQENFFHYDHELKRWVDKSDAPSRAAHAAPPPPKSSNPPCRSSGPISITESELPGINAPPISFDNRRQSASTSTTVSHPASGPTTIPPCEAKPTHPNQIDQLLSDLPRARRRGSGRNGRKDRYVDVLADKIAHAPPSEPATPTVPPAQTCTSEQLAASWSSESGASAQLSPTLDSSIRGECPRKRGRPSKVETERRRAAAEARGETYPPPRRSGSDRLQFPPSTSPAKGGLQIVPYPQASTPQAVQGPMAYAPPAIRFSAPPTGFPGSDERRDIPDGFESLVLRWTTLEKDEIQALSVSV